MIVRVRFSKLGKVRWTSHRDVARMWERALRRAGVNISYTEGFSPRPKLSFGLALPTGCESTAEYLDVNVERDIDPQEFAHTVAPSLPAGIEVMATGVHERGWGSIQEDVTSCSWEISVSEAGGRALDGVVAEVMNAERLPIERERKGRRSSDDLRPALLSLRALRGARSENGAASGETLVAELATRPRGVRPAELARVMGVEFGLAIRTSQWIERSGSRFEPLEMRKAVYAGAETSAS